MVRSDAGRIGARRLASWRTFRGPWLWIVPLVFFLGVAILEATHGWIGYRLAGEPAIGFTLRGQRMAWWAMLMRTVPSWLVIGLLAPFVIMAVRRFPLGTPRWRRHALIHVGGATLFAVLFLLGASALRYHLHLRQEIGVTWPMLAVRYYAVYFNTFFLYYWALLGVYSAFRWHEQQRETLLLERRLAEARLETLQAQLRPHFLFNALNAIATLAREGDRRTLVRMLASLADLLRASFRGSAMIPLRAELELVQRYLDLEKLRFAERLTITVRVADDAIDAEVPRLLLQPIVENAVRHGISASGAPGVVEITAERCNGSLELRVRDTGPGPQQAEEEGTGLRNTRLRLAETYADDASLTLTRAAQGGGLVTVRLPYTPTRPQEG